MTLPTDNQRPGVPIAPDIAYQEIRSVTPGRLAAPVTPEDVRQLRQQVWWVVGERAAADLQMMSLQSGLWEAALARRLRGAGAANWRACWPEVASSSPWL